LPTAAVCGISIYLLRDFIIGILFTNEFIIMRDLFAWQIVGDTLKIGAWILAYLMIGQSMVTAFILTEIVFGFGFFGWTWLLIDYFGLQAASVAHAINYLAYWVVMYFLIKSKLLPKRNEG
jgi:PST family polysaccharide transporter